MLEAMTGQYVSWHGCGAIRFATKPAEVEWFQHVAGVAKLIGFRMEIIDPEKIKQINPFVTTEGVLAGSTDLGDGLNHADLIVGVHHRHKDGVVGERRSQPPQVEKAI